MTGIPSRRPMTPSAGRDAAAAAELSTGTEVVSFSGEALCADTSGGLDGAACDAARAGFDGAACAGALGGPGVAADRAEALAALGEAADRTEALAALDAGAAGSAA